MKPVFYILAFLMLFGCSSTQKIEIVHSTGVFVYMLPLPVEEEIWSMIKKRDFEKDSLFFQLRNEKDHYHLLITPSKQLAKEYFGYFKVSGSRRNILINNKLYPLVFESDYDFGVLIEEIEPLENRKNKYNTGEYLIKRGPLSMNELTFGIKFTKEGTILN